MIRWFIWHNPTKLLVSVHYMCHSLLLFNVFLLQLPLHSFGCLLHYLKVQTFFQSSLSSFFLSLNLEMELLFCLVSKYFLQMILELNLFLMFGFFNLLWNILDGVCFVQTFWFLFAFNCTCERVCKNAGDFFFLLIFNLPFGLQKFLFVLHFVGERKILF